MKILGRNYKSKSFHIFLRKQLNKKKYFVGCYTLWLNDGFYSVKNQSLIQEKFGAVVDKCKTRLGACKGHHVLHHDCWFFHVVIWMRKFLIGLLYLLHISPRAHVIYPRQLLWFIIFYFSFVKAMEKLCKFFIHWVHFCDDETTQKWLPPWKSPCNKACIYIQILLLVKAALIAAGQGILIIVTVFVSVWKISSNDHYGYQYLNVTTFSNFEILGWCPAGPVLPHGEKMPL